jgi:hypothetical protein
MEKGESTDGQTVSTALAAEWVLSLLPALQLCSGPTWYRNSISTSCDALYGLDLGLDSACRIRSFDLSYVSYASDLSVDSRAHDHSAKLLARLIAADPSLKGYTDLGKKAFGPWAGGVITLL